jgi:hypothetical protein
MAYKHHRDFLRGDGRKATLEMSISEIQAELPTAKGIRKDALQDALEIKTQPMGMLAKIVFADRRAGHITTSAWAL